MNKIISVAAGTALTAFLVLGHSEPAFAPVDMFIKIDDIDGEASARGHRDEIDVLAWSWGETSSTRSPGERIMNPEMGAGVLSVTKQVDKASPLLMNYCASGKPLVSVKVFQGTTTYKLYDVRVKCGSTSGDAGDHPTEEVAFYYNKIQFNYKKQRDDKKDKKKRDREG